MKIRLVVSVFILLLLLGSLSRSEIPREQGVYEYVVTGIPLSYDEALQKLRDAVEKSDFRLISLYPVTSPEGCHYRSTVLLVYHPIYAMKLLEINRKTAPFLIVDRINLFQDEKGLHVSIVNPLNVTRTILMDDQKYQEIADAHRQELRHLIQQALPGKATARQYGQIRKKGYIGRTMGVMAGGPFDEKIGEIFRVEAVSDFPATVQKIEQALQTPGPKWGLHRVFTLHLDRVECDIIGVSGATMESRSFEIVGAGADDSRKKYQCPGIDHAAAYPFELIVCRDGNAVSVRMVDMMYRMKMYFEDAGKWAFAKNMGMPGSLTDEVKNCLKKAFAAGK